MIFTKNEVSLSNLLQSYILTYGRFFALEYAATLNGAFRCSFYFYDAYAAGSLHPALPASPPPSWLHPPVPLSLPRQHPIMTGTTTLTALGMAAYSLSFRNTSTAGLFGAIAAICKLRFLPAETAECTFGITDSKAAGLMKYLANGA